MRFKIVFITIHMLLAVFCLEAYAYVGPGAGITMLGALWAVILAVILAIGGILLWPLRAMLRKFKNNKKDQDALEAKE